ncbi:MAG: hypothetical protein L6R36_000873 [Xanthoria steineri]|nr:MAG: hypothetical protein L6R36_000873 [Xanthoria steineri]
MIVNPAIFVPALSIAGGSWNPSTPSFGSSSLPDRSTATVGSEIIIAKGVDITHLLNGTSNQDFPPRSWLGFGLDMTTITPCTYLRVASSVLTLSRVINLQDGGEPQDVGGVSWIIPKGVVAPTDLAGPESEQRSFKSGDDAFQAISGNTDVEARYYAVSGGATAAYAVKKSLQRNYQYLMMVHNNVAVNVHFVDYDTAINEAMLRRGLDRIDQFDPQNKDTIEQYRSLFATIGSHIITGLNYGDRFQLQVWADNSNQEVNQNFDAHVGVEFNGLTSGGNVKAGVNGSSEFTSFEGTVQKTVTVKGGDEQIAANLQSNLYDKTIFNKYTAWANSTGQNPRLHSFQTMPLWDLISGATDGAVTGRSRDVEMAYNWIVENPKNKIAWNSKGAGARLNEEIQFLIVNDGSPVDIALSHGTRGSLSNTGNITVEFNGKPYINNRPWDNNWNTQNFWSCAVDPHGRVSRAPWAWAIENVNGGAEGTATA